MNIIRKLLATIALIIASVSISASPINVGGVVWDPDYASDFSGVAGLIYQDADVDRNLSGYGVITTLNGLDAAGFCPGCELTFQFGGYTLSTFDGGADPLNDPSGGITPHYEYTGGWVNYYVDNTPDNLTDVLQLTEANTGSEGGTNLLWLAVEGAVNQGVDTTFVGGPVFNAAIGAGAFNVIGGAAMNNIDTDSIVMGNGDTADISFSSSFTVLKPNPDGPGSSSTGSANFYGESIPEPTSLAIFALALLALGANAHRKFF